MGEGGAGMGCQTGGIPSGGRALSDGGGVGETLPVWYWVGKAMPLGRHRHRPSSETLCEGAPCRWLLPVVGGTTWERECVTAAHREADGPSRPTHCHASGAGVSVPVCRCTTKKRWIAPTASRPQSIEVFPVCSRGDDTEVENPCCRGNFVPVLSKQV